MNSLAYVRVCVCVVCALVTPNKCTHKRVLSFINFNILLNQQFRSMLKRRKKPITNIQITDTDLKWYSRCDSIQIQRPNITNTLEERKLNKTNRDTNARLLISRFGLRTYIMWALVLFCDVEIIKSDTTTAATTIATAEAAEKKKKKSRTSHNIARSLDSSA